MKSRRDTFGIQGRHGRHAAPEAGPSGGRLAPSDPIKPYVYRGGAPAPDEEQPAPVPAPRRALWFRRGRRKDGRRLAPRWNARKAPTLVEIPVTDRPTDGPTIKGELEYVIAVARDLLGGLEAGIDVTEMEARVLLKTAETVFGLAAEVEIREEETADLA
ncbi:hypothetical protein AB0M10_15255 [Streptomyces sp. NPDC051840]|uniref:hypothetical protein n=1 Tax=Streptomyces sp. NPDC051840 TaxID=3154752 RepID=UPI003422E28C